MRTSRVSSNGHSSSDKKTDTGTTEKISKVVKTDREKKEKMSMKDGRQDGNIG